MKSGGYLALAGLVSLSLLGWPVGAAGKKQPDHTTITETKKVDTGVFTGTIQTVDSKTATVVVTGHEVSDKTLRDVSQAVSNHIEPKIFPRIEHVIINNQNCIL